MTHEEILDKQIEAYEKLLQLKQAVIDEQERKINKLEAEKISIGSGTTFVPSVWQNPPYVTYSWQCNDGQPHAWQYPSHSHNTAPYCSKCGAQQAATYPQWGQSSGTVISTSGQANSNITTVPNGVPVFTTGLVQPVETISVDGISQTTLRPVFSTAK